MPLTDTDVPYILRFSRDNIMRHLYSLIILITINYISMTYASPLDANNVSAPPKLILSGIEGSVNSDISLIVLKQAYRKLGIEVEYNPLPGERALQTANSGKVDGEVFRIINIQKKYPNLIPIPTPINILEAVAFSKQPDLIVSGWHSLSKLSIGIQVGIKFAERGTRGMSPVLVDTNEQLFKMLNADRIDVAAVALTNGLKTLSKLNLTSIYAVSPPIQVFPLYHYLHKKHAALVPRLNTVLAEMAVSGDIKKIRDTFLKQLLTPKR